MSFLLLSSRSCPYNLISTNILEGRGDVFRRLSSESTVICRSYIQYDSLSFVIVAIVVFRSSRMDNKLLNIILLGSAFMVLFTAFQATGMISVR
jgi:hypothetical protein